MTDWEEAFKATGWSPPAASVPAGSPGDDWEQAFASAGWKPTVSGSVGGGATLPARPDGGPQAGGSEVEAYIRQAAAARGIDPDTAIKVAQSEGGLVPNQTGSFATGKSFWPFQLHYGGKGYEQFGTVAGMGNTFTAKTGLQPGDPAAWRAATDYALDAAKQQGWGAWYGARKQGITGYQGINKGATGAAGSSTAPSTPGRSAPTSGGGDWESAFRSAGWMPDQSGGSVRPAGAAPSAGQPAPGAAPAGGTPRREDVPAALQKQATAASWALSQLGSKAFYNLCQRFIEQAYGTGGNYGSAAAAGKALFKTADPSQADVGDLVFFKPDASNGYAGHAAIYLGNGEMVGATNAGVTKDNLLTNPYWRNLLVGFGDPPGQWQGRAGGDAQVAKGAQSLTERMTGSAHAIGADTAWEQAFRGAGFRF